MCYEEPDIADIYFVRGLIIMDPQKDSGRFSLEFISIFSDLAEIGLLFWVDEFLVLYV